MGYDNANSALINIYAAIGAGAAQTEAAVNAAAVRDGGESVEEWAAATRESREAECYKRWPAICAAGIIPFGGGREEKRRRRAECADFAIRGAILKGVEKALKDAARGQKQQRRKANGGAATGATRDSPSE